MNPEFEAATTALERGFTVIEASAGTGKTTTISAIVLRLLIERGLPIEAILIATYTELATAELRGRIREIIRDALRCLGGDGARLPYVAQIIGAVTARKEANHRLQIALQNFDLAAIFTIHGFCARVLAERAFESGALFELELVTDQSRLLREVADDFWRTRLRSVDPIVASALSDRLKLQRLFDLLTELTTNPALHILPEPKNSLTLQERLRTLGEGAGFEAVADQLAISLQAEFCEWARRELRERKAARQIQSFDDLLTRLDLALAGERGAPLRASLREQFPVALIDEFQDTDPVQYSILSQIYRGSDASVFLIGDPKQAIYGFRGADVFAYLGASKSARRSYTLGRNWRSEAKLVDGVSALFRQRDDAFVIDGIEFAAVRGEDREGVFSFGAKRDEPLRFWIASGDERVHVEERVAQEIARLLTSNAKIGGRKIAPKDIAILINANKKAAPLQRALARYRLPTVVYTTANVFKSGEAKELLRLMRAIAQPGAVRLVRAALATEMLGVRASGLENLTIDEAAWEERLNNFAEYHLRWRDRGFIEMMRELLTREGVRGRLLALPDGERRLTNVLHLLDLLHVACAENRFGIDGLTSWLQRQTIASEAREEYELRLESDDDAVRLVTIHKSKGLEYGVTFYPHAKRAPWSGETLLKFHANGALVLDLEKSANGKAQWQQEELAESVRQLYVALTRAKHRSYVVWPESSRKTKAALAWLFDQNSRPDTFQGSNQTASELRARFAGSDSIKVEAMPAAAKVSPPKVASSRPKFSARNFTGEIDRSWGLFSFSALARATVAEPETPDYDSMETPLETEPLLPAVGIHAFPGGTRAGTCLHKILEQLDFQNPGDLEKIVAEQLKKFHFEGHENLITRTIEQLLKQSLGNFSLNEISARVPELEFTFPITALAAGRLQEIFGHDLPVRIGTLQFKLANGFMNGFIDLVFEHGGKYYFADWKSNWLGPDASFYSAENLAEAMSDNFYLLQLSIYGVAMHRFLQKRVRDYSYEKNFGGAFYFFLRGLDHETGGVFSWRPPLAFIEKLDLLFHGNA